MQPVKTKSKYRLLLYPFVLCLTMGISVPARAEPKTMAQTETPKVSHQQIIYMLLVGELAANRNMPAIALTYYTETARLTKNPSVAEAATAWSVRFQNAETALMNAQLWADNAPRDLQAQLVTLTLLIGNSIEGSLPYLKRIIEIDPPSSDQYLSNIQSRLSPRSAEHLNMALQRLAKERPNDPYTQLDSAQSAALQGDIPKANLLVDAALTLKPDLVSALMLKARLIRYQDKDDKAALAFLDKSVAKFPNESSLRLFYASALIDANQTERAITELQGIRQDKIYGGDALILLGDIYLKTGSLTEANEVLTQALQYPNTQDQATFLLGTLFEQKSELNTAIQEYAKITPGPFQTLGFLRAATLLKNAKEYDKAIHLLHEASPTTLDEQKALLLSEMDILADNQQLEEALHLSDEVLSKLPNDIEILLAHSRITAKLKKWDIAEKNLKTILKQDPDHPEATAHLGLVLWHSGKQQEAQSLLQGALRKKPDNEVLLEAVKRLQAE